MEEVFMGIVAKLSTVRADKFRGQAEPRDTVSPGTAAQRLSAAQSGWPIAMLGVPFDNVTMSEAILRIEQMIASRQPHYLATPNVDFLVQAQTDVELRRILFQADLVLCDGTPLLWASRLLGNPLRERVAGSDLVPLLIRISAEKRYRLFFLGGTAETTARAVEQLQRRYPDLQIAGHYSPPYAELLQMDHAEIRRRILQAAPDVLFVCFGCPKQEKWIAMHYRSLQVPVVMGVGGTIDFLAGRLRRAPLWMRKSGLEWIFRLAQEPRRLFGRYMHDLGTFGFALVRQWCQLQLLKPRRHQSAPEPGAHVEAPWLQVAAPEWLDRQTLEEQHLRWEQALAKHPRALFDLSKVRFIDSTGVGFLIRAQKQARCAGRQLVFLAPSESVRHALHQLGLDSFFDFAADHESVDRLQPPPHRSDPAVLISRPGLTRTCLAWQGELTAENADAVWARTESYIRAQALWQRELQIDLSQLRFIDSTGAGLMVRAKRTALQLGVRLGFNGVNAHVRNVLQLCRLEAALLDN